MAAPPEVSKPPVEERIVWRAWKMLALEMAVVGGGCGIVMAVLYFLGR